MKEQQDVRDMYPASLFVDMNEHIKQAKKVRKMMRKLLKEDKRYHQIMQNLTRQ